MPAGSFKKLSVPPRLNDRLLEPLSVSDHAKYLFFHSRYRRILDTIQRQGGTERAVERFGQSADWLRTVDHLMLRWSKVWAFAYIHHTYPAFDWPDDETLGTVDPLTFAFLWYHGFEDYGAFRFQVAAPYACPFCGRTTTWTETVFRFGVPSCGCGKRILNPTSAYVMVSDDFGQEALVDAFRRRCREQRVLDLVPLSGRVQSGMVFAFVGRRAGSAEEELRGLVEQGLPTFILGKNHAANSARRKPIVGGVKL